MKTRTLTTIQREDIATIAVGAAFLGTGGGGDPYVGKLMAEQALLEHGPVEVIPVDELPDDALVVPVAMMGAPTVMLEKLPQGSEAGGALEALQAYLGRRADAILCIEAGGLNSTIPIAVAARAGLPIVDADAMGRAFPELQMVSLSLHGVTACPMVIADEKGNSMVLNATDNPATERFARVVTVEMGGSALIALYPMTGQVAKAAVLRGSMSLIHHIGSVIDHERRNHRNPSDRLAAELGGIRLFDGRVLDVDRRTEGGFARGSCRIQGLDQFESRTMTLSFQNEFLLAIDSGPDSGGRPRAMTPDLICLLDLETGEPVTTEQMRYGFRVTVFGLPCDKQWRSEAGLALVGPRYFGYDMDYQPVEQLASMAG